jgi:hypothetical protein
MCDYSNQASIRREALADMICIAEEAGLYEAETKLYGIQTTSVGEIDWQKTCSQAWDAIKRVRKLHKVIKQNNAACGDIDCCGEYEEWNECQVCFCYYPCDTIKALDGEQE